MLVVLVHDQQSGGGESVPRGDPGDDSISRWVLHHYRFDLERRLRRNVLVGAYNDEAEFDAALATAAAQYSITDGACTQSAGTCNTSSRGFNSVVYDVTTWPPGMIKPPGMIAFPGGWMYRWKRGMPPRFTGEWHPAFAASHLDGVG